MGILRFSWTKEWGDQYLAYSHASPEAWKEDGEIRLLMSPFIPNITEVVDFGCGDGLVKRLLATLPGQQRVKYTGVDPDDGFLDPRTHDPFMPEYRMTTKQFLEAFPYKTMDLSVFAFSAEDSGAKWTLEAVDRSRYAIVIMCKRRWRRAGINPVKAFLRFHLWYFPQARKIRRGLKRRGIQVRELIPGGDYDVGIKH